MDEKLAKKRVDKIILKGEALDWREVASGIHQR